MKKYIFLIPILLFACKKNDNNPRITIRQQPSKITVFDIDTGTGVQSLQYEIIYFYDEANNRFDSISVAGNVYRFNYTRLTSDNKILLNYTNASAAYNEIIFDADFYSLKTYNELLSPPTINTSYNFSYDGGYKLTGINYTTAVSDSNFSQSYLYKSDSIFIHTSRPSDACQTTDSVANTYIDMSTTLPFLLFVSLDNTCGSIGLNLLKSLPVSNAVNKFPSKIINGNMEVDFSYTGDVKSRLAQALIIKKERNSGLVLQQLKFVITY